MACVKLGSKSDAFQRKGQAWFCTTGLPSDIVVEVGEMSFHLHKFPLLSRSGVMERLIAEAVEGEEGSVISLSDLPGGAKMFELVAKFCYGVKLELTSSNVVYLRCAAEHLEMTEEYGEGNLIFQTETFLIQVVLKSWKESLRALQTCDNILSFADQLNITKRCIEALAVKASTDPNLFGWPVVEHGGPMQSPGGSVLWNGISTGARPKNSSSDWWYDDASTLSFPLYKRLISVMESRGLKSEIISGSIAYYAKRYLPGLNRRQGDSSSRLGPPSMSSPPSEEDQRLLVEEIDRLLPMQKGLVSTKFLFGLLRTAMILRADSACLSTLEKRVGMQLDQANLEDLLMPNFSYSMETLYNVDCVQRILEDFLIMDQANGGASPCSIDVGQLIGSPSLTPITMVAKLIDGYLAEVAPDINLKLPKFQALAGAVPEFARPLDDGLYRAIDIYLKSHPWLSEAEREQLCRLMDCQKLSLEACTHAAQNERLPLRIVVQVLFFEQLQLRNSIAGCFLVSENLEGSRQLRSGVVGSNEGGWATAVRENQVLKVGMDNMRMRVSELEQECTNMRNEIEKLGRGKSSSAWGNVSKKLGFRLKSQMCSAEEGSVSNQSSVVSGKIEKLKEKPGKHKKNL
ncbi:BTB/POZ domain-containing protein At1g30440-like isoform X1 [Chenopodium quinoa]|uniref:BTB/POZ domain-containing protein At1g30440-like isoform X1 n=1 Tax=Chenopodium quinoa TaxID=63459 RepID=UPI000B78B5AE|nr:BTB/POZ domain-containing protein At1g30440-like isoform X1 [Chenopodium quinoa]XP_021714812.1 BTB/POZ domain-containing protein At1g30440-like isoform X1 [Chenopodium quinoa]XP_021714813.1 BTB/POZ domain-containing protein At1g30440-like isoform X1 [Chenopodium quinoa]XP_021714814.1 BTB/POZ domain-containing protein At1g30440-like isoform X1 [Chenopodium quinoa]